MSNEERRCLLDEKVDVLLECPFSEDVTDVGRGFSSGRS